MGVTFDLRLSLFFRRPSRQSIRIRLDAYLPVPNVIEARFDGC